MFLFKKYLYFSLGIFETNYLAYRLRMLILIISDLLMLITQYYLWKAIYSNSETDIINGYSFELMIVYIFTVSIVNYVTETNTFTLMSSDIKRGSISMQLIKPLNYHIQLFFQSIGDTLGKIIFSVIPVSILLIVYCNYIDFIVNFKGIVMFIISLSLGYLLTFILNNIFGNLVFYTTNSFGILQLKKVIFLLFTGSLIPIEFYPEWLRIILDYLPFKYIIYLPVSIITKGLSLTEFILNILIQIIWVTILFIISRRIWNNSINKLVIYGG